MAGICVILGALPFAFGGFLNRYLMNHMDVVPPYWLIGVGLLLVWGGIGFLLNGKLGSTKKTVVFLNLIPFADLVLLGVQELILGEYWRNAIGSWSQLFYRPRVNLGATLMPWGHRMFVVYTGSFLLMVAVSFAGCKLRGKR